MGPLLLFKYYMRIAKIKYYTDTGYTNILLKRLKETEPHHKFQNPAQLSSDGYWFVVATSNVYKEDQLIIWILNVLYEYFRFKLKLSQPKQIRQYLLALVGPTCIIASDWPKWRWTIILDDLHFSFHLLIAIKNYKLLSKLFKTILYLYFLYNNHSKQLQNNLYQTRLYKSKHNEHILY